MTGRTNGRGGAVRIAAVAAVAVLGLDVTGCGGGGSGSSASPSGTSSTAASSATTPGQATSGPAGDGGSTPTPTASGSSGTTEPTGAQTPSVPATGGSASTGGSGGGIARCSSSGLAVTVEHTDSAAGSTYYRIRFRNTSGRTCSLDGFPGVSAVGEGNGTQLGRPAGRTGGGQLVTLAADASGYATLRSVNIGDDGGPLGSRCGATAADGWRIYPPEETRAVYVKQSGLHACTGQVDWLQVTSVRPAP